MKKRVWLKQLRLSRGLTQESVAAQSFIDRGFYAQIENGTRDPSMHVASNIANTLGFQPQIFFVEHLCANDKGSASGESYSVFAHSDLNLRYTWIWHPHQDMDAFIGKRDDEILVNEGISELMYVKKQVVLQGVPLEKVILFPQYGTFQPFLVRGEPLLDDSGRVIGVYSALTYMPDLLEGLQSVRSIEPRGLFEGHILYFYESPHKYVENVVKYILDGVEYGYHVCIVDSKEKCLRISDKLRETVTDTELKWVHYIDNQLFYESHRPFDAGFAKAQFTKEIAPIVEHGVPLRVWTRLQRKSDQGNTYGRLKNWECELNEFTDKLALTTVCAYNATKVPASLQTALLHSHEYFMTDNEFVYSPLYTNRNRHAILPALAKQVGTRNQKS
ncbi:MEDS domain-containing protein [Alicyclobacillus tolerans]|uniref:MEDS domain-containing protein n=1 Tax=Alicyclobacillus tolerans TaxID=90970 RepID=UPI001F358DC3|nr:MEDS domain-containing protein [Alicyclobacillus tolerans]MCF8565688.1 MEDS domain-containing protein [Alicyclobacillus tolerans]